MKSEQGENAMLVTAIIPQKKDPAKRNIFIDGEFAFSLIAQDVLYFKLREGEPIPQETYDTIQDNLIYIQAQETALHYLGYKMRTEAELRRKLTEKEFAPQVIEKVMDFLCRYGYCDDKAYVKSFVKERLRLKPKGAYALKMELRQKGISEKIAEEVLAETDLNESEDAARWILKKTRGNLELDEKEKQRLYGFLQRKGYRWDTIREAMALVEAGEV